MQASQCGTEAHAVAAPLRVNFIVSAATLTVAAVVTGLTTKTVYYYKVVASNAVGTTNGTVLNFTTN